MPYDLTRRKQVVQCRVSLEVEKTTEYISCKFPAGIMFVYLTLLANHLLCHSVYIFITVVFIERLGLLGPMSRSRG